MKKPDLTISDLKRALVEVKRICWSFQRCVESGCPFFNTYRGECPIRDAPDLWMVDDWKEDSDETD